VVEHTEAVLAYYYKDEEGQLKTTEIFKLEDSEASVDPTPSPSELVSALAAKKLRHHGSTRSVISAVSMEDGASPDICPSPSWCLMYGYFVRINYSSLTSVSIITSATVANITMYAYQQSRCYVGQFLIAKVELLYFYTIGLLTGCDICLK